MPRRPRQQLLYPTVGSGLQIIVVDHLGHHVQLAQLVDRQVVTHGDSESGSARNALRGSNPVWPEHRRRYLAQAESERTAGDANVAGEEEVTSGAQCVPSPRSDDYLVSARQAILRQGRVEVDSLGWRNPIRRGLFGDVTAGAKALSLSPQDQ